MGLLLTLVAALITVVVVAPIALSSGELVRWAASPTGLGLAGGWPWLVFVALDAAAGTCVLLAVYCAWRGRSSGVFGKLVWVFAGFSAFANYRHGIEPNAPSDAWWFFPIMSVLGPGLLEAVTRFVRAQVQRDAGRRGNDLPHFGLVRWLPLVGAPRDTYGARRTAQLLGISTVAAAVATYHELCPSGSLRVVRAIRARDVAVAQQAAEESARAAKAAARAATNLVVVGSTTGLDHSNGRPTNGRAAAATSHPSATTIRATVGSSHALTEATTPTDHSPTAVADAATIRQRYPTGLPDRGAQRALRTALGWHAGKATNAIRAYLDGADLSGSGGVGNGAASSADPATGSGTATSAATGTTSTNADS
jgi:hypothetical protein